MKTGRDGKEAAQSCSQSPNPQRVWRALPSPVESSGGIRHSGGLMGLTINKAAPPTPARPGPTPNLCPHVLSLAPSPGPDAGRQGEESSLLSASPGCWRLQQRRGGAEPRWGGLVRALLPLEAPTGTLNQPQTQATRVLFKFLGPSLETHTKNLALISHLIRYTPTLSCLVFQTCNQYK